jgi:hypothetical protein
LDRKSKRIRKERKVFITTEREVITYAEMWHTSKCLLEKGQKQSEGSTHQFIASLVFTAFALEAYFNHVGSKLFECWADLESLNHWKKLNVIAERLKVPVEYGSRPWQIMKGLFSFRNAIAHGKSETLRPPDTLVSVKDSKRIVIPPTEWEKFARRENAERAREDVETIVKILYEAAQRAGHDVGHPFLAGMQTGTHTVIELPNETVIEALSITIRHDLK